MNASHLPNPAPAAPPIALLREPRPQDSELARRFVRGLSQRSLHRRFHGRLPALGAATIESATAPGGDGLAVVALSADPGEPGEMVADARLVRDGNGREGELAVVVAEHWRRRGLARSLLLALQQQAVQAGLRRLRAEVQADNMPMRTLLHGLGYQVALLNEDAGLLTMELRL